jgi:peptidyl-dipeptidase Dcp
MQPWNTPFQTPPFDIIEDAHYAPAIREAMSISETTINEIAMQSDEPTFDNTIVRLETATEPLDRCTELLFNINECNTNPVLQQTVMDLVPELSQFENRVWMNSRLFARVESIYEKRGEMQLDGEQMQLLEKYYQRFVRNGVVLDEEKKRLFNACTEELATLSEQFNHNALNDTNEYMLHIVDSVQLGGLPADIVEAAREEATRRGLEGWVCTLHAPSYRPFLTYADDRSLREQMWRAYNSRGNRDNGNDNKQIVSRIVELRLQKAQLLGYDDYASYSLCRTMAETEENVTRFLDDLLQSSLPFARNDLAEVKEFAHRQGADYELQNWDFSYWSEKL